MPASVLRFRRPAFALLLLLGALALRWPSLGRPIWHVNEGATLTMAQQVLAGQLPYRDSVDHHAPLVPYFEAMILAMAGDWNTPAVHAGVALLLGLTAIFLWLIGRQHGQEPVGVIAALIFTWLGVGYLPVDDAMAAHAGWFGIFFSSLGFWLFGHSLARHSVRLALSSGAAFGLAGLSLPTGLLDSGVCLVLLLLLAGFDPGPRARLARLAGALLAGLILPLAATVAYFQYQGALADLIFYTWTYHTQYYMAEVSQLERLWALRIPFVLLLTRLPVILILGLVAARLLLPGAWASLRHRAVGPAILTWLILGWSAAGLLSTVLSGRDFNHGSIPILPGLSLACGWLLARAHAQARAWRDAGLTARWRAAQFATVFAVVSVVVPTVAGLRQLDTSDDPVAEVGRLIQAHSRPEDRIFVWGYVPEMHVHARRLPNTRFLYSNGVTGLIPWTNLDWLKDTSYAVIPGTPEQLRQDFDRYAPTVVVDTGTTRGYLKYPLKDQAWLWPKIEHEFAEVAPEYTHPRGFRVYRRIAHAEYGAPFPAGLTADPTVQIEAATQTRPATFPVRVSRPAGTTAVELYKDGELYRRFECPPDQPGTIVFSVLGTDLPEGERRLQALVRGGQDFASTPRHFRVSPEIPPTPPAGPPMEFNRETFTPLEATTLHGPSYLIANPDRWDAHAPAKLVYERPPGLYNLEVEFGLNDAVYEQPDKWKSDGVEFVVQFQPQAGPLVTVFRRPLNPQTYGRDRGIQKERVLLPPNEPGRIILSLTPGPLSDVSHDVSYWKTIRGLGAPGALFFRDQRIIATHIETTYGFQELNVKGSPVVMVHAPSRLDFPVQKGMHRLTGTFGLLPGAWNGPKKSAGAVFEFWHVPPAGPPRLLHQHQAAPGHDPTQRVPVPFAVDLPYPQEGLLRLVTRPAHPQDNAFNYTYWGPLTAEEFTATILAAGEPLNSTQADTTFGFTIMEEENKSVIMAHAPSRIAFPLPPGLRQLSGQIGLLAGAYTGGGPHATEGGRFVIEVEDAAGRRTEIWQRELNPRDEAANRGFIDFSVELPRGAGDRLILRTDARPGRGPSRAWTFWHGLRLEP